MAKLIQSFNFESFSLFSKKLKQVSKPGLLWQVLGPSDVEIQCKFSIIQYCIIYIIWRLALIFIPRPEHSRPRPKTQGQGQRILRSRPRNLALRPRTRINIPDDDDENKVHTVMLRKHQVDETGSAVTRRAGSGRLCCCSWWIFWTLFKYWVGRWQKLYKVWFVIC